MCGIYANTSKMAKPDMKIWKDKGERFQDPMELGKNKKIKKKFQDTGEVKS